MIKEAENIILNKQYYELSVDELATVSELVANAEEFEDMKWFLASTQQALVSEKIEATPDLKKKVMEHLNQPKEKRRFWLNGVIPFLLPEDKRFYQKPAFQMSVAALLIIGFLLINNNSFKDSTVALNDGKMIPDKVGGGETGKLIVEDAEGTVTTLQNDTPESISLAESMDSLSVTRSVISDLVESETLEEIDEISHDGFYSGELSEDDLKKIEESKNRDLNNLNSTGSVFGDNGGTISGKADKTVAPAIVDIDDESTVTTIKNNNQTVVNNPGQTVDMSGQPKDIKGKKKSEKDRRLKQNADAYSSNNEVVDKPEIEQNLGGGFDNKYRDETKVITESDDADMSVGGAKDKEFKEIRPFSMHVNETKELKKLFTVYK